MRTLAQPAKTRETMMNKVITAAGALMMTTAAVNAAGLDRSGQSVSSIFESGTYFELSYGNVNPTVSGELNSAPVSSGDVAPSYAQTGIAFKTDVNDKLSFGMIVDQPFGAAVNYNTAGYPLYGVNATVTSTGLTFLGRYQINEAFSVHAGLRSVTTSGSVGSAIPAGPYAGPYGATFGDGSGTGYVVGAAYEKPEIALRLALTYASAINVSMPTLESSGLGVGNASNTDVTLPQSVNVDFQTGIAANTLLMASVRWADWTATSIKPADYTTATGGAALLDYANDGLTYSIGVGRKFSDALSASVSYGWEKANNDPTLPVGSNLAPTDGYQSIQVGASYAITEGAKLSGGVRYVWIGDSSTSPFASGPTTYGVFTGNSAIGVGVKLSFNF